MADPATAHPAIIPLTSQIADGNNSSVSLSGAFLVIVLLVAGVLLFRRFLMPITSSMLTAVKQVFGTPVGRVVGLVGVVVVGFLLLSGL